MRKKKKSRMTSISFQHIFIFILSEALFYHPCVPSLSSFGDRSCSNFSGIEGLGGGRNLLFSKSLHTYYYIDEYTHMHKDKISLYSSFIPLLLIHSHSPYFPSSSYEEVILRVAVVTVLSSTVEQ